MGSKKELDLFELFYRDRIKTTWKNLGEMAQGMYETPEDALHILSSYSQILKKAAPGTYALCDLIETERKKTGKKVMRTIDENLEKCCNLIRQDYERVSASRTDMNNDPKLRKQSTGKLDRQMIINRIAAKHYRLVKNKQREFKSYQKKDRKTKALNKLLLSKVSKK